MNIYEYVDNCREAGLTAEEAMRELEKEYDERWNEIVNELEERQSHTAYQQDLIDMRRFEQ